MKTCDRCGDDLTYQPKHLIKLPNGQRVCTLCVSDLNTKAMRYKHHRTVLHNNRILKRHVKQSSLAAKPEGEK